MHFATFFNFDGEYIFRYSGNIDKSDLSIYNMQIFMWKNGYIILKIIQVWSTKLHQTSSKTTSEVYRGLRLGKHLERKYAFHMHFHLTISDCFLFVEFQIVKMMWANPWPKPASPLISPSFFMHWIKLLTQKRALYYSTHFCIVTRPSKVLFWPRQTSTF